MEGNIIVDEEEKRKREERLKRFGPNDEDYLRKISKDKSMKITPDDIYLPKPKEEYKILIEQKDNEVVKFDKKRLMFFGVYLMNTNDIEKYLNTYNFKLKKIYWLNDFSCVCEFDTEEISMNCFWLLTDTKYDSSKTDIENYNWKKAKKYVAYNTELDIEIRVSQEGDTEKNSSKNESYYSMFYHNKKNNYNHHNDHFYKNNSRKFNNYNNRNFYKYNYDKFKHFRNNHKFKHYKKNSEDIDNKNELERSRDNDVNNDKIDNKDVTANKDEKITENNDKK